MNRRDLLKRLAGIPMLGVLVPVGAKTVQGFDLASGPDMTAVGVFDTANMRYKSFERWSAQYQQPADLVGPRGDLSEDSIERMCKQMADMPRKGPMRITPTHVHVRLHEFGPSDHCIHCGASAEAIEDGLEPLGCWKRPA